MDFENIDFKRSNFQIQKIVTVKNSNLNGQKFKNSKFFLSKILSRDIIMVSQEDILLQYM